MQTKKQNACITAILILLLIILSPLNSNKIFAETLTDTSNGIQEEIAPMPEKNAEPVIEEKVLTPEETATLQNEAKTLVEQDENVTPESLGVKDQTTLPDQKFAYAFK